MGRGSEIDGAPTGSRDRGLTSAEVQARLKEVGPNAVREEKAHPLKAFLKRLWAPIPWLLEATIIIQLFLLALLYFACLDWVKVWLFTRLNLR